VFVSSHLIRGITDQGTSKLKSPKRTFSPSFALPFVVTNRVPATQDATNVSRVSLNFRRLPGT
jgi:hypothetical protein